MNGKNDNKIIGVIALVIAILSVSIGFAALSSRLEINGVATVGGTKWEVKYQEGSETCSVHSSSSDETMSAKCGLMSLTNDTTVLNITGVKLVSPGDSLTYRVDAINTGSYTAKVAAVTQPIITCTSGDWNDPTDTYYNAQAWCEANLTANFTYADDNEVVINDILPVNGEHEFKMHIEYIGNDLPSGTISLSIAQSTNYGQN